MPRHGRHGARPALRQPVLARGPAATLGRGARARSSGGLRATETALRLEARHARLVLHRPLERGTGIRCRRAQARDARPHPLSTRSRRIPGRPARAGPAGPAHDQCAPDQPRHQESRRPASKDTSTKSSPRTSSACPRNPRSSGRGSPGGTACRRARRCSWTTALPCSRRRVPAGVRWVYQVLQPDSTLPPRAGVGGLDGIPGLIDLAP